MSIWNNPGKVFGNFWDKIINPYAQKLSALLKGVENDAERLLKEDLVETAQEVFAQAKKQLGDGATVGQVINAAIELGIPLLKAKGHTSVTALLFNVVSALAIAFETHEA